MGKTPDTRSTKFNRKASIRCCQTRFFYSAYAVRELYQFFKPFEFGFHSLNTASSIPMWHPSMKRSRFVIVLQLGQIKIGVIWSLPYSRFSAICKEGQL
ncbi:hypothetical protein GQ457_16G016500 [Hibiscus cannabinus]